MRRMSNRAGFTLVELTLSMVFISVLSISVVLIISNTVVAYQRGITLSRVNSVGTDIVDDMRMSVQGSSARALASVCTTTSFKISYDSNAQKLLPTTEIEKCKKDNAFQYIYVAKEENVKIGDAAATKVPIFGAFCTGTYSYLWNSGYFEAENAEFESKGNGWIRLSYLDEEDDKTEKTYNGERKNKPGFFRLIKLRDENRTACVAMRDRNGNQYVGGVSNEVNVSTIGNGMIRGEPANLLPDDGGNDLALYDLAVQRPAMSSSDDNLFYSVSFILGTVTGGVDIMAKGNNCAPPQSLGSENSNYCAINKFNFALQVDGG